MRELSVTRGGKIGGEIGGSVMRKFTGVALRGLLAAVGAPVSAGRKAVATVDDVHAALLPEGALTRPAAPAPA